MYLIRLAFAASAAVAAAATAVRLVARRARRAGFYRGGVREPLFPPEMRPSLPSRVAPRQRPTLIPINLSSLLFLPPSSSLSSFLAVVVEDENRIYIPSLARPGKYYERMYAPAATSYDKRDSRRRKIDALVVTLLSTCRLWPRLDIFTIHSNFEHSNEKLNWVRTEIIPV